MSLQGKTVIVNPEKSIMFHDDISGFKLDLFNSGNPSEVTIPIDFPEEKLVRIKLGLEHKLLLLKEEASITIGSELERINKLGEYFKTTKGLKEAINTGDSIELLKQFLEFERAHQNRSYIKRLINSKLKKLLKAKMPSQERMMEVKEEEYQVKNIIEK